MRDRLRKREPYRQIIHKMYLKTILITVIAILVVLILRSAGRGTIGNWITSAFCRIYNVSWDEGVQLYRNYVRRYYLYVIGLSIIGFFLLFFRVLLAGFTHYFDEIIKGVNTLADGTDTRIVMSEELHYVENKFQQVKDELAQKKREKEDAEKRKDELIVYLAHDIKTPLTSVIGYLNLLTDNPEISADKQREYLKIALDKSLRLENLIGDFFEITRSHVQEITLERTNVNLAYFLEQVVDEAYPLLQKEQKKVEVSVDYSIQINVDAQKMARVFLNLLRNAIYYCTGNAPILIKAEENTQNTTISFSNEGYMDDESIKHIFDKFYRADSARQTKTGGSGLGLAIAQEIVQAHGGEIKAFCQDNYIQIIIIIPTENLNNSNRNIQ